jgi:hypothetical protein
MFLKCKVTGPSLLSKDAVFTGNTSQRKDWRFQESGITARIRRADALSSLQLLCDCILTDHNCWILCPEGHRENESKQGDRDGAMRGMKGVIFRETDHRNPVAVLPSMLEHEDELTINRIQLARVG